MAKDACEICKGDRGGVPGNENIINGKIMCDYCHAEQLENKDIIVNFYDEGSPVHLSADEQRRIESYVKENGIVSGTIRRVGEYIGIVVSKCKRGSKYERERDARRSEARAKEHLTVTGSDSLEDNGEQGDDYNGRS